MRGRGHGYKDSQPPCVDSNTLYSAQECLNRRALGKVPYTENPTSSPAVNRTKIITSCKPWGPRGGALHKVWVGGHTGQHMGRLGRRAHTQGQPRLGRLSEQLSVARSGKSGWKRTRARPIQGVLSATESDWINLAEAARAAASTHA